MRIASNTRTILCRTSLNFRTNNSELADANIVSRHPRVLVIIAVFTAITFARLIAARLYAIFLEGHYCSLSGIVVHKLNDVSLGAPQYGVRRTSHACISSSYWTWRRLYDDKPGHLRHFMHYHVHKMA
jgi:hypothetical protein